MPYLISLAVLATVLCVFYRYATADARRRTAALAQEFPAAWQQVLTERVAFYLALTKDEKRRFERQVQVFLASTRITGGGGRRHAPPAARALSALGRCGAARNCRHLGR